MSRGIAIFMYVSQTVQIISQWCAKWKLYAVDYLTDLVRDPDDQLALIEL